NAFHVESMHDWLQAVVENMAEVTAAMPAMHHVADHEEAAVGIGLHLVVERRPETRPAGAAVKLGLRREQRLPATGAVVDHGPILLIERARTGALGAVLAQHMVLRRRQAPAPLLVAELHLESLLRFGRR